MVGELRLDQLQPVRPEDALGQDIQRESQKGALRDLKALRMARYLCGYRPATICVLTAVALGALLEGA